MALETPLDPQIKRYIEEEVSTQLDRRLRGTGERWSRESMLAAMRRIEERRKRIAIPPDELDQMLEEHRREFGHGPLVEEDGAETAGG